MSAPASQAEGPDEEKLEQQVRNRIGSEISGVGVLEDIVGIGGMATVYRAETPSGEAVAVKLMHNHLADKGSLRRRFLREAKILDQVDHPNSIKVFDRGSEQDGEIFFVMELLDGWEVETVWKKKDRKFPVAEALEIGSQALACLHAYHRAEVLHRDLKPSNLFFTREGQIKVIDFGVARFHDEGTERTRSGTALGTPAYMAPEQAMGKVEILDARSDVYGLGAVLFTLLSGRRPHEADSNDETLVMAATQPVDSVARHAPGVPAEVVQVVDTALSWDPDQRYDSAAEMRSAIQSLLEDSGIDLEREEVEEEIDTRDEELGEEGVDVFTDIDERSIEGMKNMFDRLEHTLQTVEIYEWEHDKTTQLIDHTYRTFREIVDREGGEARWKVRPHSFEIGGDVVWEPDEDFNIIPYNLFLSGIRRLQLQESMLQEEFDEFLRWLYLDPEVDLPPEDDMVTALRDLKLESVDFKVIMAPSLMNLGEGGTAGEDPTGDLMDRAESMLEKGAGKRLLTAMRAGAYAEAEAIEEAPSGEVGPSDEIAHGALGQDFTLADRGLVEKSKVDQLSEFLEEGETRWKPRIQGVIADLWSGVAHPRRESEFLGTMDNLVELYLDTDRLVPLLQILVRSYRRLEEQAERRLFHEEVLDGHCLRSLTERVVGLLAAETKSRTEEEGEVAEEGEASPVEDPEQLLKWYWRLLKTVPGGRFEILLDAFDNESPRLRRVIARYLYRHAEGREGKIARRFPELGPEKKRTLLRIVGKTATEAAFEVLAGEIESEHSEVRTYALNLLAKYFDLSDEAFDLNRELRSLIDAPDEKVRIAALQVAREAEIEHLVPPVAKRIANHDFTEFSSEERRELLQTLVVLNRAKAEEVACEIAEHHGFMPSNSRQQTRVLAFQILGEIGHNDRALEAAESGKSGWWWNSDEVATAAEEAYERIERRREVDG